MTAGGASQSGRYRPNRKRRASTAMIGLLAAVIAAVLLVVLGARAVVAHPSPCPQEAIAQVAASGEIAPAVQRMAGVFNRQHQMVAGHCAQIAVRAATPALVAGQLAVPSPRGRQPAVDAWIPDSQLWIDLARSTPAGQRRVPAAGSVIARTDLLIVMPRPAAAQLPAFGSTVGWNFLLPSVAGGPSSHLGLNIQFPDPAQSTAGLATLVEIRKLLGYGRAARFALARFVFNVQVVPAGRDSSSLASLDRPASNGGAAYPVTVTSERAVVQFDRSHPQQPLAVRYPAGGSYELTFPYLVTATSGLNSAIGKAFGTVLRSSYAAEYVRYEGFRSGDGALAPWPAGYGLQQHEPPVLTPPGPGKAASALRVWHKLSLGERLLALNDISKSMAGRPVPDGPTLEQILGHAAALGLARFPDSTQMGLWAFASHLPPGGQPYKEVVSLGPLPGPFGLVTRRQAIEHLAASATTAPTGAALYKTILAAYQQMTATYQPQYQNAIIVMTAGVDSPRDDMPASRLLRDLKTLYNRSKPVNVVVIVLGRAADFGVLQKIALATNGKAYQITSPPQIRRVFYHAMGRRICQPHCPK